MTVDTALSTLHGDGHWPHEMREFGGEWARCEASIEAVSVLRAEVERLRESEARALRMLTIEEDVSSARYHELARYREREPLVTALLDELGDVDCPCRDSCGICSLCEAEHNLRDFKVGT